MILGSQVPRLLGSQAPRFLGSSSPRGVDLCVPGVFEQLFRGCVTVLNLKHLASSH